MEYSEKLVYYQQHALSTEYSEKLVYYLGVLWLGSFLRNNLKSLYNIVEAWFCLELGKSKSSEKAARNSCHSRYVYLCDNSPVITTGKKRHNTKINLHKFWKTKHELTLFMVGRSQPTSSSTTRDSYLSGVWRRASRDRYPPAAVY